MSPVDDRYYSDVRADYPLRLFVSNGARSDLQKIKAIFVMTSALMLKAEKKITKRKSKSVFTALDKAFASILYLPFRANSQIIFPVVSKFLKIVRSSNIKLPC